MEQQLKQRLVGVGVIFSLAIIFLPLLLDGSGRRQESLEVVIPPRPDVTSEVRVEEKIIEMEREVAGIPTLQPVIIDEVNSPPNQNTSPPEVIKKAQQKAPAKAIPEQSKLSESAQSAPIRDQIGGESWVIQVGSFSDKNKAYQLRDKLRKSKLSSVFIEQYQHQGTTRYRVRMGPFIQQKKAKVVQNKVRAKYDVNGLVMRYEK